MSAEMEETDELEAMLPWYAAGALSPAEAARIEAALARRPKLRASLALVEEDRGETIGLNESLGAPSAEAWARVLAVAEAEPRRPSLGRRVAAWLGLGADARTGRLSWIGGAAVVVMTLQTVAIVSLAPRSPGPGFETASAPTQHTRGVEAFAGGGVEVLVRFAPDARVDQLSAFLREYDATIIDGPRAGFYRLRVGDKSLAPSEAKSLIATLGAAPIVKLALPAAR